MLALSPKQAQDGVGLGGVLKAGSVLLATLEACLVKSIRRDPCQDLLQASRKNLELAPVVSEPVPVECFLDQASDRRRHPVLRQQGSTAGPAIVRLERSLEVTLQDLAPAHAGLHRDLLDHSGIVVWFELRLVSDQNDPAPGLHGNRELTGGAPRRLVDDNQVERRGRQPQRGASETNAGPGNDLPRASEESLEPTPESRSEPNSSSINGKSERNFQRSELGKKPYLAQGKIRWRSSATY